MGPRHINVYVDEILKTKNKKKKLMEFVPQKKKKNDGIQNIRIYPLANPHSSGSSDKNGLTPHETLTTCQRQNINFRACMEMVSHISLKRR